MVTKKRTILSSACALAMVVNGFAGLSVQAQEKKQEKVTTSNVQTVTIRQSGDGAIETFNITVGMPQDTIFTMPAQGFSTAWANGMQGGGAQTFGFVSAEMNFDNKVVKGAPFTADAVTEFTQTLGDGNRIQRSFTASIARDGEGRTRREQTPFIIGSLGGNAGQHRTIFISDPVNDTSFTLDSTARIAHKMPNFARIAGKAGSYYGMAVASTSISGTSTPLASVTPTPKQVKVSGGVLQGSAIKKVQPSYPSVAKAAGAEGAVQLQITVNESGDVTDANVVSGHPLLRDSAIEAAKQWKFKPTSMNGQDVKVQGVLTFNFVLDKKPEPTAEISLVRNQPGNLSAVAHNTESLGKQTIEGIEAEGTRTVDTIPAGTIGNERPIEIVNERWYSQDLQTLIMSRQSDPRIGETVFKLTNINRSEPDASLFKIPSDYTVMEGPQLPPNIPNMMDKLEIKSRKPNEQ